MSYEYGKRPVLVDPALVARERLAAGQAELVELSRAIQLVEMKAKGIRTRLVTAETDYARLRGKLAGERERLEGIRKDIHRTQDAVTAAKKKYADEMARAQGEAARILLQAERDAALIREAAYVQARVLAEKAYTSGVERARDTAMARTKILGKRSSNRGVLQGVAA